MNSRTTEVGIGSRAHDFLVALHVRSANCSSVTALKSAKVAPVKPSKAVRSLASASDANEGVGYIVQRLIDVVNFLHEVMNKAIRKISREYMLWK